MHIFPRENRIPLCKIARNFENNHEIHHFPVWRRKSGHVVRSRGHTCEKNSPGGKKELLDMVAGNMLGNFKVGQGRGRLRKIGKCCGRVGEVGEGWGRLRKVEVGLGAAGEGLGKG